VLITANSTYYPLDQIPEFWSWVHHQATSNRIKIPREIMEEIKAGRQDDDPLLDWICTPEIEAALLLDEAVDAVLVQRVVATGYAPDLHDDEVEKIGRDPFLIAYALADSANRVVVTTEVSRPSTQRANRKVPDVSQAVGVASCGPFALNKALGFRTGWRTSS
jgi:hypothetical protein